LPRAHSLSAQAPADPARSARIADTIGAYDKQGVHRTATEVDALSGRWLAGEATRAGASVEQVPFAIDRIDIQAAYLLGEDGTRIDGLPLFDSTFTDAAGVRGRVGAPGTGNEIAVITLDQAAIGSEGQSLEPLRRSTGQRAIVAVTQGGRPGLCPSNARTFTSPFGVPVLQVSSVEAARLGQWSQSLVTVTLVSRAERTPAHADNIMATMTGRQPDLPPVIVMTPRSGWWQCASERGGGISCWLEIIRAVAAARPERTVRFLASSGHELGHLGLDRFLEHEKGLVAKAAAWIHLGANIGAAGGRSRLQSSADDIEQLALKTLERAGATVDQRVPRGTVPGGEARNIHVNGGRYISLLGSGPRFHNPDDRWPDAVDLAAVDRFAAAFSDLAITLAKA
jgi:hypothetical protein